MKWQCVWVCGMSLLLVGCGSTTQRHQETVQVQQMIVEEEEREAVKGIEVLEAEEVEGQDEGLFSSFYPEARMLVDQMTQEEKVGQVLLARCPDVNALQSIKDYHLGGYILFRRDFEGLTGETVKTQLAAYKEASTLPFILAVDEEGGTVVRMSSNPNLVPHRFLSPQQLDQAGGLEAIEQDAIEKARYLTDYGITMNLAPVADISLNPTDYIYPRTFGKGAEETAAYVKTVVDATQAGGVSATLKHFPGYGGNVDTHVGFAYDTRSYEQFVEEDYLPFQAGIEAGVESILVSHNIVEALDKAYPASLSVKVHQELRDILGFTGIIITDDLEMEAIKGFTHGMHPAVQALLAGNDLIIVTDFIDAFHALQEAVYEGVLDEALLDEVVTRLLAWKLSWK